MPNLTEIGVEDGAPVSGTGTVSTLDAVLALMSLLALPTGAGTATASGRVNIANNQLPIPMGLITDAIYNSNTALTPKFKVIDHAVSGDNTLITAVTAKKLRVLSLFLISAGTVNVRFESGTGGTALTGQMNLVANAGFVLPFNPVGWFETASATLLNLELSGAVSVDGNLVYVEV